MNETMKAARLHRRGGAEGIIYEDAPRPGPGEGDALVRVHATAITPTELTWSTTWTTRDGKDRVPVVPSHEVSGVVEALGNGVREVAVGDAVYALLDFWRDGAAAEYVAARASDLAPKPRSIDHAHAAAIPLSGLTAWQALFDHGELSRGQHVLIHGAAGGVGTFAVQFARWCGAHVTATASADNAEFLRQLGAADVIDYRQEHFEDKVRNVDVALDTIGGETLERSWKVLRPGGALISVASAVSPDTASRHGVRGVFFIVQPNREQLIEIARLVDASVIRPMVEAVLPLALTREAYLRGTRGHSRGKLVLRVRD
jgi:NADPH:quinone reductase-like Zn-dependent oxidoreductase